MGVKSKGSLQRPSLDESILQCLCEVIDRDRLRGGEIGNRPRHADDAVEAAGGEVEAIR